MTTAPIRVIGTDRGICFNVAGKFLESDKRVIKSIIVNASTKRLLSHREEINAKNQG